MQQLKFPFFALVALLLFVPSFGQKLTTRQVLNEEYEQALDLFRKEKYASAQQQFDKIARHTDVTGSPYISEAMYYAAVCSQQLGNNDALYRLDEFLRLYPQSNKTNMVRFYQGNYHYSKSEYSKALLYYKQVNAPEIDYGYRNEYEFKKGYCYLNGGDYESAKKHLSVVKDSRSKYKSGALYYYAHILYMEGSYDLALTNFQKLERDRRFARIVPSYLARIYYYLGREDELLQMLPSLFASDDLFRKSELQQMVGEVYFNRGEYANAIAYYRLSEASAAAESSKPSTSTDQKSCNPNDNTYQMGYSYYMLHNYDSAAIYLRQKATCNDSIAQNALYTLGDTYIKLNRKSEARSMFRQAASMSFDAKVKEDAQFNYAKLSCELGQNQFNESIRTFEDYLKTYPTTKHKAEIQEILTSLYCTTRNYKDALRLIEPIEPKSATMNQAYQRIVINRGIELFNERDLQSALQYFKKAVAINAVPKNTTDAYYLLGETHYRLDNRKAASAAFDKFFISSNATRSPYYAQALYTHGYLQLDNSQYAEAASSFRSFLQKSASVEARQRHDAHNRLGDCLYAQKKFEEAIQQYDIVINAKAQDADYATYQKALSYGVLGRNEDKMTYLNYIFERYQNSSLAPKAMLEIASTYLVCDNNEMALRYYERFIDQYPQSSHVAEALLSVGLIYYNTSRDSLSLVYFDRLLNNYQGTAEARDALAVVKNIYIEQNRVDEYFTYVQQTTKTTFRSSEQDSTIYLAAANRYYEGDCEHAITGLETYLKKFPNGLFSLSAHYYLADCLIKSSAAASALSHYETVINRGKNQYTEASLLGAAGICFNERDYKKALKYYSRLTSSAENSNAQLIAYAGKMRCCYNLNDYDLILASTQELLSMSSATVELKDEAWLYRARAFYSNSMYDSADAAYTHLRSSSKGEYAGEALYRHAEMLFNQNQLRESEKAIEAIVDNSPSDYWLAKTFILWADIFYLNGNSMQAKQTLQSIIDNYDGNDIVQEALAKRNAIIAAEEGLNDQDDEEEEEIIITIPSDGDDE